MNKRRREPRRTQETFISHGTELYHGTNSETVYEFPEPPAWFTTSWEVAKYFSTFHCQEGKPRIHLFRARQRIPKLLRIDTAKQFDDLMAVMKEKTGDLSEDPRDLARSLCNKGFNGWIIPDNYSNGDDIMLCAPRDWLEWRGETIL